MNIKTKKILELLNKEYPNVKCELNYNTPFQLLVATILSAQTTDKKVNEVTKQLFIDYPTVYNFSKLTIPELEDKIRKIGLYRNKAKNILKTVKMLIEEYNGQVPSKFDDLVSLHGVGRKTANVVLANAFNVPTIAVDTHVFRVSNRIGLANAKDVLQTEKDLQKNIPKKDWIEAHHLFIFHGRNLCIARKPKCEICPINRECKYFNQAE
ncbi:endonuclease III [Marinisporobacter balticus]|uniref:Endonuclease III n=1 Tax=Marinisporobacter balticus TaxID=2018667 RepID=A0A4R2KY07_9FIRM|nr:endonuclease III [Marinisporobacter balticus]TCO79511.1 DNA-(apurinic or apyrimidinic site) lyase /endonuclease III [Marinisporobacter balticus]